jgi:hypothetical protein
VCGAGGVHLEGTWSELLRCMSMIQAVFLTLITHSYSQLSRCAGASLPAYLSPVSGYFCNVSLASSSIVCQCQQQLCFSVCCCCHSVVHAVILSISTHGCAYSVCQACERVLEHQDGRSSCVVCCVLCRYQQKRCMAVDK